MEKQKRKKDDGKRDTNDCILHEVGWDIESTSFKGLRVVVTEPALRS